MTRDEAQKRAEALDARAGREIRGRLYERPHKVFSQIRGYLLRRSDELETKNNPIQLVKFSQDAHGLAVIVMGPTLDKGSTPEHFHFDSGARLSFGVTLRERDRGSELLAFRFHYQLPQESSPVYLRFDLNESLHQDPLSEPRCHLHPGMDDVRIPMSLHDPIEVLDRVFFGVDKLI